MKGIANRFVVGFGMVVTLIYLDNVKPGSSISKLIWLSDTHMIDQTAVSRPNVAIIR